MMAPSEAAGSAGGALRYQCDSDEPDDSDCYLKYFQMFIPME
jgi:hypothetical protein